MGEEKHMGEGLASLSGEIERGKILRINLRNCLTGAGKCLFPSPHEIFKLWQEYVASEVQKSALVAEFTVLV